MIDELKEEEIVNKVGGRFKLSTLIQKRMIALNQGARALVDVRGVDRRMGIFRLQDQMLAVAIHAHGSVLHADAYRFAVHALLVQGGDLLMAGSACFRNAPMIDV